MTTVGAPTVGAPTVGAPTVGAPTVGAPTVGAPTVGAADDGLPGLAAAADPRAVAELVASLGMAPSAGNVRVEIVRHHPGRRCTLRYSIGDNSPLTLYAKVFAAGSELIAASAIAVAGRAANDPQLPWVAPVIAHIPRWGAVVYGACPEPAHFHEWAVDPATTDEARALAWHAVGRAIAALHRSAPGPDLPERPVAEHLGELDRLRPPRGHRNTAARFDAQLADLIATSRQLASGSAISLSTAPPPLGGRPTAMPEVAPCHGSLRTDQLAFTGPRVAMLDLDSAGLGDPASDLANLFTYLAWKSIRVTTTARPTADAAEWFTHGYGPVDEDRLRWWGRVTALKIVGRRFAHRQTSEYPLVRHLLDLADQWAQGAGSPLDPRRVPAFHSAAD